MAKINISSICKITLCGLIRGYQILLSPYMGRSCRFEPSCSEYTLQAIQRYGALKGVQLGASRLSKCHPFCPGGLDPL